MISHPLTGVAMWWRANHILMCHRKAEGQGQSANKDETRQTNSFLWTQTRSNKTPHSFHIALVSTNETPIYSADDNQESQGRSHQDFRQMYSIWSLLVFFANVSRLNSRKITNILLPLLELFVVFMLSMPLLHYLVLFTTSCGLISLWSAWFRSDFWHTFEHFDRTSLWFAKPW